MRGLRVELKRNVSDCVCENANKTYVAHMKEARFNPLALAMKAATSRFSPPRSPRTLDGKPNPSTASVNICSTVSGWLSLLARKPTICEFGQ